MWCLEYLGRAIKFCCLNTLENPDEVFNLPTQGLGALSYSQGLSFVCSLVSPLPPPPSGGKY